MKELIETLRAPWRKPENKPPEMEHAAEAIESLIAERDAAFAMSKCECESNEACANLAALIAENEEYHQVAMNFLQANEQWAVDYKELQLELTAEREKVRVLRDELLRVKGIMLRECGIGIVNEVVLAQTGE